MRWQQQIMLGALQCCRRAAFGFLFWVLDGVITKGWLGLRARCYLSGMLHVSVAHGWVGCSECEPAMDAPFGDNYLAELFKQASKPPSPNPISVLWHWLQVSRCFAFKYHRSPRVAEPPICIVMLATRNIHRYAKYAIETNRMYAARHGYDFRLFVEPLDRERHASWHKICAVRGVLGEGVHSGVFWIDADAIVTDFDTRIEELTSRDHDLAFTTDPPMFFNTLVNGGVWFCRNTEWSRAFMARVWEAGDTESAVREYRQRHPWEQVAINLEIMRIPYSELPLRLCIMDSSAFNYSYRQEQFCKWIPMARGPEPFIHHMQVSVCSTTGAERACSL